jgi:hypothetical protein
MNDADRWIYFDGPEPEHIRPLSVLAGDEGVELRASPR